MAISYIGAGAFASGTLTGSTAATLPAGTTAGDLLLLVTSGAATPTTPTGYTLVSAQGAGQFISIYQKIAVPGETAPSITISGSSSRAVILLYRGTGGTYDVVSAYTTSSLISSTTASQTTKFNNDHVLSIYAIAQGTVRAFSTAPTGTTLCTSSPNTASVKGMALYEETKATAGATTARTASVTSGTATWSAVSVSVREPQDLYWTGTGNWSSTTLWKVGSTGGVSMGAPPTQNDNAVFANATGTCTINAASVCNDFTMTSTFAGTIAGTSTLAIYGSYAENSSLGFVWSYSGTITFAATTTGKTISSVNGYIMGQGNNSITFNGTGGGWTLSGGDFGNAATATQGATATFTLTAGSLNMNSCSIYAGIWVNTGTATRSLQSAGGYIWVNSVNTTIVNTTSTGFTAVDTVGYYAQPISSSAGTRTITLGTGYTESNAPYLLIQNAGDTVTVTATSLTKYYLWNTPAYGVSTLTNTALTIYGAAGGGIAFQNDGTSIGSGDYFNFTAGTNAWTFAGTQGLYSILTNAQTLDFPIIFNGVGGTWQLQDALTVGTSRTVTLTNGTINLNNLSLTCGLFSSAVTNTRAIAFGTSGLISTVSSGTVFNLTGTGFTYTGTSKINISNNSATATTVTLNTGFTESNALNVNFTTGSYTLTETATTPTYNTIDFTGFSGTLPNVARVLYGGITTSTGMTLTAGTNATSIRGTSGIDVIKSNAKTFDFPLILDGVGGTFQLFDDLTVGATRSVTLTSGTLDLNNKALSSGTFVSSTTNIRTIAFGTSGSFGCSSGNPGGTILDLTTSTNLTITGTSSFSAYSAATTTTYQFGTSGLNASIILAGTSNINGTVGNLEFQRLSGSPTIGNNNLTILGNFTGTTLTTYTAGTNTWTFAATSGTKTIDSKNITLDFPITFNGVGGTWQLVGNLTVGDTRTVTLTNGALNLNNNNFYCGIFSSNNSNTRSIAFGTGQFYLTGNSTTVLAMGTVTGYSYTGTPTFNANYNGGTGTRIISFGGSGGSETNAPNINVTAGTDGVSLATGANYNNINFTGYAGALGNFAVTIFGDLTISTGMSLTAGSATWTFGGTSGTSLITSNAKTFDFPVTFNGVGGTWQLVGNLTVGDTRTVTLTNGALNLNNNNFYCGFFSSSNSNTRSIAWGTGQFYITGSNGGAWRTDNGIGLTFTGTPTVNLTYSGATGTRSVINASGSGTYNTAINLNVTAGTDIITAAGNPGMYNNVNFTGFSNNSTWFGNILGNLTLSNTMTQVTTSSLNLFDYTGTQNVTTNGITVDSPVTIGQRNTVSGASGDGTTATVTFASSINFVYPVGSTVEIVGITPVEYNGTYTVTASTLTSVSFLNSTTTAYTSGGSVYSGSTVNLLDALTVGSTKTLTFNRGTFNLNNNNVTTGLFSSNNPGTRTFAFGTGQFYLTGTNATIWNTNNITNATITGTPIINATGAGTAGQTRVFANGAAGGGSEATSFALNVTAGSDALNIGNPFYSRGYNFTGFSGTLGTAAASYYVFGDLVFSPTMSFFGGNNWYIWSTTTNAVINVTTNGVTLTDNIRCGGTSPVTNTLTVNFVDALNCTVNLWFNSGTVKFLAGSTNTVGGVVTNGTTLKYLRSSTPGTRAFLSDASGTNYVSYLDVQDSYATGGGVFDAINPSNVDSGNNLGWGFSSEQPFLFFY